MIRNVLALSLVLSAQAIAMDWQLVKNKNNIVIEEQTHPNGFVKIKATTSLFSCISAFEQLLHDTANAPSWLSHVQSVTVLSAPSAVENYVHTQFSAPWPVKNRDMVTYSITDKSNPNRLQIGIQSASDFIPLSKGFERIEYVEASWIVEQKDETVVIEHQVIADPGGNIPKWLANSMARKSAYQTFVAMRKKLGKMSCAQRAQ